MDLGAKGGADDSVLLIDEIKLLVRTVHRVGTMLLDRALRLVGSEGRGEVVEVVCVVGRILFSQKHKS